ncbi:MAG: hypothetical protein J6C46_01010 [Clostridia bacterium]|nr:hypothetical protein [Clostridia bacterium]
MNNSKKGNKKYLLAVLVLFILALAAGYAAFSDTLIITGTANASGKFDMEFTKCTVTGAVGVDATATKGEISTDKDTLTVTVKDLAYPGAGAQFDVVVTNVGTVPAKVNDVRPVDFTSENIIIEGLEAIGEHTGTIAPGGTCEFSFTVEWDPTKDEAVDNETVTFGIEVDYTQDTTDVFEGSASHGV